MFNENESKGEILKRSPLSQVLLNIQMWKDADQAQAWRNDLLQKISSFDLLMQHEVDVDWKVKSFYPVFTAIETMYPIFKPEISPSKQGLYMALFGAGYEIGETESIIRLGTDIIVACYLTGILNYDVKDIPDDDISSGGDLEMSMPMVFKSLLAVMRAGASFKEGRLSPYQNLFDD